jgi:uncharacterized protein (TIGR03437 family)
MPWLTVSRRVILPILLAAAVRAQCPNSMVAGPPSTYAGDGQPAISAWLLKPNALSLDASGNLYIADSGNNRIREVTTDGVMHTVAGPTGLNNPQFVLAAPNGSVYIADSGDNQIRLLTSAGVLTTIAGTGHPGYSGDNGAAIAAELNYPTGMALDAKGNLYFADMYNSVIRRVDVHGVITTVPTGNQNYRLYTPQAVAIAGDGSILIADPGREYIFRVAPDGTFSLFYPGYFPATNLTVLSDGTVLVADGDLMLFSADGSTLSYYARAENATSVAVGGSGVYYTSTDNVVYRAATPLAEPAVFAGQYYTGNAPDNVPALGPIFGSIGGMVVGPDGSIWVGDTTYGVVRKILPNGTQRVIAAGPTIALALDSAGNLYAAGGNEVLKITPAGSSSLFAGGGTELIPALGAPAMAATGVNLSSIAGVATDSAGNVYVLSQLYDYLPALIITRITPGGQLTTIWDSTFVPYLTQDELDTAGFAMDSKGYLLVALYSGPIFRIATDGSGISSTSNPPDDLAAIASSPTGEIFYVTEARRIKALNAGATLYNRDISPVQAGTATAYFAVEAMVTNILAVAELGGSPYGGSLFPLATDAAGNVYFGDSTQNVIRRFPAGACFTARAPQLLIGSPVETITPPLSATWDTTIETAVLTFAPGELISIFGSGMGPQTGVNAQPDSHGLIATQLAGTQVLIEGVPAPVLYTSDGRVNTVIPFSLYGYPKLLVQVAYNGNPSDAVALTMSQSAPIIFTNSATSPPVPIVINQDGSVNSPSNPAAPGSIISFYGSGFGLTSPAGIDGHLATAPLPEPVLPVTAEVDGWSANVLYAGDAVGMVEGVMQVNLQVPPRAYYGFVSVVVGNNSMQFDISIGENSVLQ